MKLRVGVWIDHRKAAIVFSSGDGVTAKTLESGLEPHPRFSGHQDGGGEKQYEERYAQHLDQYYDRVIRELGQPEALFIFGPGEAKRELKERLGRTKTLVSSNVAIETADKLTDLQIVSKVKEHFGIDH